LIPRKISTEIELYTLCSVKWIIFELLYAKMFRRAVTKSVDCENSHARYDGVFCCN